jgi:hypothetical protein
MGLFGPFVYKSKKGKGEKYFLHVKEKGKVRLYYFSKDPVNSLSSIPRGYEVIENKVTFLPMLKKRGEKAKPAEGNQ